MSIMDIRCWESLSTNRDCSRVCASPDRLLLGADFQSYLIFELPPYAYLKQLKKASLILYKIPTPYAAARKESSEECSYSVRPLQTLFTPFSYLYTAPKEDEDHISSYLDLERDSYTQVDITEIVKAWVSEELENMGLILKGEPDARLVTYASEHYSRREMYPMLRLQYEDSCICPPLTTADCTIEVEG
jgi:hypothetical protein